MTNIDNDVISIFSDMENLNDKDVDYFSFEGKYTAKITDVYDGDTCHAIIPFINGKFTKIHVRMIGYNCPEIKDKDLEKKHQAKIAKELFSSLVLNKIVSLECGEFDKYGRVLGRIKVGDIDVNKLMTEKYGKYMI
jgi:endonuclease YncB( thermonuclease family)